MPRRRKNDSEVLGALAIAIIVIIAAIPKEWWIALGCIAIVAGVFWLLRKTTWGLRAVPGRQTGIPLSKTPTQLKLSNKDSYPNLERTRPRSSGKSRPQRVAARFFFFSLRPNRSLTTRPVGNARTVRRTASQDGRVDGRASGLR